VVAALRSGLALQMKQVNANPRPHMAGQDPLPGKSSYFLGHDPGQWRTNIPHFARVHYRQVYPGVDLICHGNQGRLQYDFVIAPGADLGVIRLAYEGAQQILVDRQGDLILKTAGGEIKQSRPVVYQETGTGREIIEGRYVRLANNQIGFRVSPYDAGRPLVIDPIVNYSSYLGGSGDDAGNAITLDPSGNIYLAGTTSSPNFPKMNPLQSSLRTAPDAFVVKLNPTGSALIYATYLGGDDRDSVSGGFLWGGRPRPQPDPPGRAWPGSEPKPDGGVRRGPGGPPHRSCQWSDGTGPWLGAGRGRSALSNNDQMSSY
jgi:hypothetical protein